MVAFCLKSLALRCLRALLDHSDDGDILDAGDDIQALDTALAAARPGRGATRELQRSRGTEDPPRTRLDLSHLVHALVIERTVAALLCLVLLLSATVQWNDPDPLVWMLVYGTAAVIAGAHAVGRTTPWWIPATLAAACVVGTLALSPSVLRADLTAYTSVGMRDATAEQAREALGLAIAAASCAWIARRSRTGNGTRA